MTKVAGTSALHYAIRETVVTSSIGDELILLDLESGVYHSLNAAGTPVWTAIERGLGYKDIVASLTQEFDVSEERAAADVAEFLDRLITLGLVQAQ